MEITDLGLTQEELTNRVVDSVARKILERQSIQFDEDGLEYTHTEGTPFNKEIQQHIKDKVDEVIAVLVDKYILPNAQDYVERLVLQETNRWGEKIGKGMTFIEYLTARANAYMTEKVDYQGKSKEENRGYSFTEKGTRIEYMIHKYLKYHIENWAKDALKTANNSIAEGLQKAVEMKLKEITNKLKFSTNL